VQARHVPVAPSSGTAGRTAFAARITAVAAVASRAKPTGTAPKDALKPLGCYRDGQDIPSTEIPAKADAEEGRRAEPLGPEGQAGAPPAAAPGPTWAGTHSLAGVAARRCPALRSVTRSVRCNEAWPADVEVLA